MNINKLFYKFYKPDDSANTLFKKFNRRHFNNNSASGFTLVEIMIGIAIFVILFLLFNEFVFHSRRQAENIFQKGDNLRDARLALQRMEFDARSSAAITDYEETADAITMTLKHVKEIKINTDPAANDTIDYDYITYTLYLTDQNAGSRQIKAFSLLRSHVDNDPGPQAKAGSNPNDRIVLKSYNDNLTDNTIGVLKEYEFPVVGIGVVKRESKFFIIDNNYYVNVLLDDTVTPDKKDEMIAKASYKGKYNGAEIGFTDITKAIGVCFRFIISDNNKNVNYFDQIIYLRNKM